MTKIYKSKFIELHDKINKLILGDWEYQNKILNIITTLDTWSRKPDIYSTHCFYIHGTLIMSWIIKETWKNWNHIEIN